MTTKSTIGDVAKAAGVSKKTVSRVLNQESGVKEKTRKAVHAAIEKLDYIPNLNARRLRTKRSYLIGILYVDYPGNFYSNMILSGAIKACDELGYDLLIRPFPSGDVDAATTNAIRHMVARSNVDGIIVIPPLCDNEYVISSLNETDVPLVKIAALQGPTASNFHCDEVSGAERAVEHLVSLGHSKIAYLSMLKSHAAGKWRYQGYINALQKLGIEKRSSFVSQFRVGEETVEHASRRLLTMEDRPTAIFAANDSAASIIYRLAQQLKIRIPYDLSVVGFDNDPIAENLWPPLTTIKQPANELGYAATYQLIKTHIEKKQVPLTPLPECELIIRNSTGPLMAE